MKTGLKVSLRLQTEPKQKLNLPLDFIRDAERAAQKDSSWAESNKLENWRQQKKKQDVTLM